MCQHENEEKGKKMKKWNSIKNRQQRDFVLFSEFFYKKDFFYLILKKFDNHMKKRKNDKEKSLLKMIKTFYFKVQINLKIEKKMKN